VQQIVGPLLEGLAESGAWKVTIVHPINHSAACTHQIIPNIHGDASDHVDLNKLVTATEMTRTIANGADVLLSIDRWVPSGIRVPRLLMSNSAAYYTEASAVAAAGWSAVVVPTRYFAGRVRGINPVTRVEVVGYGMRSAIIERLLGMPPPNWEAPELHVLFPHRPDPRKGHVEAIEGVAHTPPGARPVRLMISWLDEERYEPLRRECEGLLNKLKVDDLVQFLLWCDDERRWDGMAAAHGVVQVGAFEETFGLAAVEAALAGRVLVTNKQPAIAEVVPSALHCQISAGADWRAPLEWAVRQHSRDHERSKRERHALAQALRLDRMVEAYDRILRTVVARGR